MTTNLIFTESGPRVGHVVGSVCPSTSGMAGMRRQPMLDAAWIEFAAGKPTSPNSTRVSVPGCRGAT